MEKIVIQRDSTTIHHHDTTYRRDSIYIKEWMKGDTVFIDRYSDRLVYRDRWRDSIVVKHDTTAIETMKEVKVEKPLSRSQSAKIKAFWWLLAAVVGFAGWTFRRPIIALVKKLLSVV